MKKTEKITDAPEQADGDKKAILLKHFPQCFDKNGALDVARLQQALADEGTAFSRESYTLDWLGKSYARVLAGERPQTLLAEDEAFNAKAENAGSGNMLIKGDNLEALKHLSHAYHEKIKMIYIDPPYNTGSDGFVYHDDRRFTVQELSRLAGVEEEQAQRILDFTRSKSNSHSAWLTFMYPRLYVARRLLREDGVIFISIDDNEVAQLRMIMDEIFGNSDSIIWHKAHPRYGKMKNSETFRKDHDYILVAYKNQQMLEKVPYYPHREANVKPKKDERGEFYTGYIARGENGSNPSHQRYFSVMSPDGNTFEAQFEISQEEFHQLEKEDRIYWTSTTPYKKIYLHEKQWERSSSLLARECGSSYSGNKECENILGKGIFSNPKPSELIKKLILFCPNDSLVLDFFAGSGTTGDAVMRLNAEDGGCRRYILVQLDELIDAKNSKTAYDFVKNELGAETPTIFDITKERLLRAARQLQSEHADKSLDLGFKVFTTKPIWEDYEFIAEKREQGQVLFDETQLTADDLKALLLTWRARDGMPFTRAMQPADLGGYTAYYEKNRLYLLDKGFTSDHLCELLRKVDMDREFNPATVIAFGYHFKSAMLREMGDNIKNYVNRKNLEMKFITRY